MRHLSRMISYAVGREPVARENFSTELLAFAIGEDATPITELLSGKGILLSDPVTATTQTPIPGIGIVDLTLTDSKGSEVWVEVKVWARESGDQLVRYQAGIQGSESKSLVMLSAGQKPSLDIPWFTWHEIAGLVERKEEKATYLWREIATLIREQEYGGAKVMPFNDNELEQLESARSVLQKIDSLFAEISKEVKGQGLSWFNRYSGETPRRKFIGEVFIRMGELLCQFEAVEGSPKGRSDWPAYFLAGIVDGEFVVAVESSGDLRKILGDSFSRLNELGWEDQSWRITMRSREMALKDERTVVDWVLDRLKELDETGAREAIRVACESVKVE